jgi:hypothetical protein
MPGYVGEEEIIFKIIYVQFNQHTLIKKIETKLYTYFLLHLNELRDEQSIRNELRRDPEYPNRFVE